MIGGKRESDDNIRSIMSNIVIMPRIVMLHIIPVSGIAFDGKSTKNA